MQLNSCISVVWRFGDLWVVDAPVAPGSPGNLLQHLPHAGTGMGGGDDFVLIIYY